MQKFTLRYFPLFIVVLAAVVLAAPVYAKPFPDVIPLPNGFFPEGIVVGKGHTAYVGSLANGDIYVVDLRSGEGEILVNGPGTSAVGLAFDDRSQFLFVAGGDNGDGRVYDSRDGSVVATLDFGGAFVNDVVVTRQAAYFTDSFAPVLYKVPLNNDGSLAGSFLLLPLGGDFMFVPNNFNSNGIVATPNGSRLIIVNTSRAELYNVDPNSGEATLIDLNGGSVASGDGLVLNGKRLYVVQNFFNQVAEFKFNSDYTAVTPQESITDSDFDIPTTASIFGNSLYLVNARFTTTPGPNVPYDIVRVDR